MPYTDEQTKSMPTQPVDTALSRELPEGKYDFNRPLYRCQVCKAEGESNLHKYVDDCHYFLEE